MPIANRYYESVRGMSPSVLQNIADSNRLFPVTENVRQVWTSTAAHRRRRLGALHGPHLPEAVLEQDGLRLGADGHLVATFALIPDGTDFHSHNAWNLVASDDEWDRADPGRGRPGRQRLGGRLVQLHRAGTTPLPRGTRRARGGAYETPLRDKTHGRIYRIVAKDGKPSERPKLSKDDPKGLVAALKNDNMFWRLHAQRLLVERGRGQRRDRTGEARRRQVAGRRRPERPGDPCLWTMKRPGGLGPGPRGGPGRAEDGPIAHPSAAVRRNAALSLPTTKAASGVPAIELLDDPDRAGSPGRVPSPSPTPSPPRPTPAC